MDNNNSQVLQNALKRYSFMLEKGYEVYSAKEIPMGWQIVFRKKDLLLRIDSERGDEEIYFRLNTQLSPGFIYIGNLVYASTGEIINPSSFNDYRKLLQKHIDNIESYLDGENVNNENSLNIAQKEYREVLARKEGRGEVPQKIKPFLDYPLMGIIILLVLGALTTLYAVLIERLFSAFSINYDSYSSAMVIVSLLLAIGTMVIFRRWYR